MAKETWKAIGAHHYSCIVRQVIVGYYKRFANERWRVYKIVDGDRVLLGEYDDEARARSEANIEAKKLVR